MTVASLRLRYLNESGTFVSSETRVDGERAAGKPTVEPEDAEKSTKGPQKQQWTVLLLAQDVMGFILAPQPACDAKSGDAHAHKKDLCCHMLAL